MLARRSRYNPPIPNVWSLYSRHAAASRLVPHMTNRETQDQFQPLPFLLDGSLNVHQHRPSSNTLVVFVHGFLGDGYETWGNFPKYIFDSRTDVGVFDYPTGSDRRKRIKTPTPESSARFLAQEISSLDSTYKHIFLFGHSMGGLVASLAAYNYFVGLTLNQQSPLRPLAGLLAFASPLGGSVRFAIPGFSDLRFLATGNRSLRKFREYRNEKIDDELSEYPNSKRYSFPIFSLSGMNDIWVKRTNSALGIPKGQAEDCAGSHTELVKPPSEAYKSVQWSIQTIAKIQLMRSRVRRPSASDAPGPLIAPEFTPGVLVARMWDTSESTWVDAFTEALISTAESYSLSVVDSRSVAPTMRPDLVIHAMHSLEVIDEPERLQQEVLEQLTSNADFLQTQVALGPTGEDYSHAETAVRGWLMEAHLHMRPWVEGVPDAVALRDKIIDWLSVVARAHMHTASSLPERRRADALDSAFEAGTLGAHDKLFGGAE